MCVFNTHSKEVSWIIILWIAVSSCFTHVSLKQLSFRLAFAGNLSSLVFCPWRSGMAGAARAKCDIGLAAALWPTFKEHQLSGWYTVHVLMYWSYYKHLFQKHFSPEFFGETIIPPSHSQTCLILMPLGLRKLQLADCALFWLQMDRFFHMFRASLWMLTSWWKTERMGNSPSS